MVRMKNRHVFQTFVHWRASIAEAQHVKYVLSKILARMTNRAVIVAWESWCAWSTEAKVHRNIIKRCLQKLTQQCLVDTFDAWCAPPLPSSVNCARRSVFFMPAGQFYLVPQTEPLTTN